MPTCSTCHVAAMTAAQSATAFRDLGVVGALSVAAVPVLAIRHKRTVADAGAADRAKPEPGQDPHR
jgi:hypothetical protein